MKKTSLLKKLILDQKILIMPGAHNAMAAKIIEQVGFEAITLGGLLLRFVYWGSLMSLCLH
jgi:methylisocitrate lyase